MSMAGFTLLPQMNLGIKSFIFDGEENFSGAILFLKIFFQNDPKVFALK
jgi:hypothetical protein